MFCMMIITNHGHAWSIVLAVNSIVKGVGGLFLNAHVDVAMEQAKLA